MKDADKIRQLESQLARQDIQLARRIDYVEDLASKLKYVLENFVETEEGLFTFPDGDTWNAKCRPSSDGVAHDGGHGSADPGGPSGLES